MNVHEIFPIVIGQDLIDSHEEFKLNYLDDAKVIQERHKENNLPDLYFLHLNIKYLEFFKSLKTSVENYLILLGLDPSVINLNVVRSWVESYDPTLDWKDHHNHKSSDISFKYYLKTSEENPDVVCFEPSNYKNDLTEGIMKFSANGSAIKNLTKYNCFGYGIPPTEGSLLIFPSPLKVDLELNQDNVSPRYVIAGDLKLTLKPKHYQNSQSIPHTSQWLDLERY